MALKVQTRPLTDEQQYTLDGCLESAYVDSGSVGLIQMYADRDAFEHMLGNVRVVIPHYGFHLGKEIMRFADDLFKKADLETQMQATASGLVFARWQARRTSWHIATWAISDLVEGGCEVAYRHPIRARRDGLTPFNRDYRRLQSPRWMKRRIQRNDEARLWRGHVQHILARYGKTISGDDIRSGSDAFAKAFNEQRKREAERERLFWRNVMEADCVGEKDSGSLIRSRSARKKVTRRYRKVIKRASSTATSIVGVDAVSKFARGEPVVIKGKEINIEVTRRRLLGSNGHGAMNVVVLDKGSGGHMADLCVYFEKMPALDQLTAVKLHLEAGIEDEFLSGANLVSITTEGASHPILAQKQQRRDAARETDLLHTQDIIAGIEHLGRPSEGVATWEDRRARNEAYWSDTRCLWVPITETFVLGRTLKLMGEENYSRDIEDYTR